VAEILGRLLAFDKPTLLKKESLKILLRILEDKDTEHLKKVFNRLDKDK
jgi:hypothetical protein